MELIPPGSWSQYAAAWKPDSDVPFADMRSEACAMLAAEIEQIVGCAPDFERLHDSPWFNFLLGGLSTNPEKAVQRFLQEIMHLEYDPLDQTINHRRVAAGIADSIGMTVSPLRLVQ